MKLYKDLLSKELGQIVLRLLDEDILRRAGCLAEQSAAAALERIQAVVGDDSLSDFDCIEKIVTILEEAGSDGGGRHDFG